MDTALLLIGLPLGVLWYLFQPISVLTVCREPGTDCFTLLPVPTTRFKSTARYYGTRDSTSMTALCCSATASR